MFSDLRRLRMGLPYCSLVIGLGRILESVASLNIEAPTLTIPPALQRISRTTPSTGLVISKTLLVASTDATGSPHSISSPACTRISTTSTDSSAGPEPMASMYSTPASFSGASSQSRSTSSKSAATANVRLNPGRTSVWFSKLQGMKVSGRVTRRTATGTFAFSATVATISEPNPQV